MKGCAMSPNHIDRESALSMISNKKKLTENYIMHKIGCFPLWVNLITDQIFLIIHFLLQPNLVKLKCVNSSPSTRSSVYTRVYHSRTMSDQRFKCYTKVYHSRTMSDRRFKCYSKVCHSRTMSDRRFKCYMKDKRALIVAQRTCDDEDLTMSLT